MHITGSRIEKLVVEDRYVTDSQIYPLELNTFEYIYLTLETNTEYRGIGFSVVDMETPGHTPVDVLRAEFEEISSELLGRSPFQLLNRLSRYRGGMIARHSSESYGTGLRRAIDYALWDLCGKHLDMPVYELMGGTDPAVPVYASGLAFSADDQELRALYGGFAELGITAAKIKVGFPTVDEDLHRLELVEDVFNHDCTLMVDANEAWSPKEAIRRVRAYRDAGFDIYWVEDPVLREDYEGINRVVQGLPSTHVNTGEYCGFEGKRRLLETNAVDILNVHGFSPARRAAHLAHSYGIPISTGTDHAGDISALHVGAALPEIEYMEFTGQRFYELADEPFEFEDGYAIAPDTPGHGIELPDETIESLQEEP